MSRNMRKVIIGITALVLVLVIGFVIFFSVANWKTRIYMTSYDMLYVLELGKAKVRGFSLDSRLGYAHVTVDDTEEFIENNIAGSGYCEKNLVVSVNGSGTDSYILYGGGYYFVAYTNSSGKVVVENMVRTVRNQKNDAYYFQFPDFDRYPSQEPDFYAWIDLVGYNSFEELADFYGRVNEGYCVIDAENEVIRLVGRSVSHSNKMTEGRPVVLTCTDEGVAVGWDEEET